MRLVGRLRPEWSQEWVYPRQYALSLDPGADLTFVHVHMEEVGRYPSPRRWDPPVMVEDVFLGWRHRLHLHPDSRDWSVTVESLRGSKEPRRGVLVACGWDNPAILTPIQLALEGMVSVTFLTGLASPERMARLYRSHEVVISLRPEGGPSYSVVEACFCGAIPIVCDTPALREHFQDGGARFCCELDPGSILAAVADVRLMSMEQRAREVQRNLERFQGWTELARGERWLQEVAAA